MKKSKNILTIDKVKLIIAYALEGLALIAGLIAFVLTCFELILGNYQGAGINITFTLAFVVIALFINNIKQ
jgi:hypothetical protein